MRFAAPRSLTTSATRFTSANLQRAHIDWLPIGPIAQPAMHVEVDAKANHMHRPIAHAHVKTLRMALPKVFSLATPGLSRMGVWPLAER